MGSRKDHNDEHIEGVTRGSRGRVRSRAKNVVHTSRKIAVKSGKNTMTVTKKVARHSRRLSSVSARKTKTTLIVIHAQTIRRSHLYMQSNWGWYARWHAWPKHRVVHYASLSTYLLLVGLLVFSSLRTVLAADLNDSWDFSTPGNYSFDSGVEASGSSARLKAQEYSSDASTSALYHMNESSGSSIDDSSSNNNDASTTGSPSFSGGVMNNALNLNGTNQSASISDSASLSTTGQQTIEGWIKPGSTFSNNSTQSQMLADKGSYKLGLDHTSGKAFYEVERSGSQTWTKRLGDEQAGSWSFNHGSLDSMVAYSSDIYAGTGLSTGDAEVWKWNGTTWSKIGGDGIRSSWAGQTYERVMSLAVNGNALYAGLGSSAGDAEIWTCELLTNCTAWSKIGGDGNGPGVITHTAIESMSVFGGSLYVGGGNSAAGGADVWKYNGGTSWTQVGGDGLNSSWAAATFESVSALHSDGTYLYAGIGVTTTDAELWRYNGTTWTIIGGDGTNLGGGASWNTNYERVSSITNIGATLYVGLGDSANDAEVWRLSGTTWSQIGGDGLSSGWAATAALTRVHSLVNDGTNLYAGLGNGSAAAQVWKWNGASWSQIGGSGTNGATNWSASLVGAMVWSNSKLFAAPSSTSNYGSGVYEWNGSAWNLIGGWFVNDSWGGADISRIMSSTVHNGKLYYGLGSSNNNAQVYEYDGTTARRVGGSGLDGSWPAWTYETVNSMISYKGNLYAGLGISGGDSEIWKWDNSTWTKVGGDGVGSSWNSSENTVLSMAIYNSKLYVGLGSAPYNGDIWQYDGSTWTLVAGEPASGIGAQVNGSWNVNPRGVEAMTVYKGQLCAGLGGSGAWGEVWCWGGTGSWTKIGGGSGISVNGSWSSSVAVLALTAFNDKLYATIQTSGHAASVWEWDGTSWTQIGGSDLNGGWSDGQYTWIRTMTVYNGYLYIGTGFSGSSNPTGDVWRWDGTSWTQTGGDGVNSSWSAADNREEVGNLITYKGKLYGATGNSGNIDALVYSFGDNAFVESATNSFNNEWYHLAGTYDGTSIKIFINGTQDGLVAAGGTGVDNDRPLKLGTSLGSPMTGIGQGHINGQIDEVRISNVARSNFTSKPYSTTPQAVRLNESIRKSGVESWDGLTSSETANGGAITYRLSDDDGTTWKYWDGSAWTVSSSYTDSNAIAVANANIGTFPVTFDGITWQAVLSGDGTQQVTLNSVALSANSDTNAPSTNATNILATKSNGGASIASNAWTNGASPYFSWDAATDAGSGISGYCLYLGQTGSSDPETTKGILGTTPLYTNSRCLFAVGGSNLDLATAGYLATALTSSDDPYYLNVKAIDGAGNLFGISEQFQFRFDNTAPNNPGFISAPSGFINTKSATITWPTTGGQAASDDNSGLLGLQYKFNSGSWYGDDHTGTGDTSDLLANDGSYTTTDPSAPDSNDIVDGVNALYIRTWDQAGNVTTTYTTAALKVNTSGAPTEPQNVVATPSTNTANSFAFSWAAPSTFVGNGNNITYCYTINTLPNVSNCSFTAAGDTDLAAGAYATQPGTNTFYVVAKDESGNINYSSFSSATFIANTPAPGFPLNMDIVDVSIKSTSNWRLAVTWNEPTVVGAGIAAYRIYRSIDNTNFSLVGSSSSPSFVDTGLSQQDYYYKVRACDSANNCSADSAVVTMLPTGKFTEPAVITSEPVSSGITTRRARIAWSTDRVSDSKILIGTASGDYSPSEVGNSSQVTSHVIDLDNLAAGTTYYYVARWTDSDGNVGSSQEYTFTTAPAPVLKEVNTLSINLSSTTLQFTVKDAAKVELMYGKNDSFGGVKSVNTSLNESTYELEISGLDDGVKYLYRISMYDSEGGKYLSSIFSFTTPPRPKIANLRFQPLPGEPTSTQQVTWDTNIPTNSIVSYGKVTTTGSLTQTQEFKTSHEIVIRGLEDNSEYFLVAQGRDSNGNVAVSDKQVFKTALDTRAPLVSDVVIEPTIRGTGAEARGQIVVSWKTDEPSTSQVAFAEGSSVTVFNNRTAEDAQLTTEHLVIISDLAPSKVYSIKPISRDKSGNASLATAQSAIVGRASDSVLNIVLNTLRKVFGL